ncbi:MAG: hypothetical protein AB1304_11315 [Bacteroidota bacterium]
MIKKLFHILILVSFLLSNSRLFLYQHFCGDELYATSLFHIVPCECGDAMHQTNYDWINTKDDGCCKETLIYAHLNNDFIAKYNVIQIFKVLLMILGTSLFFFNYTLNWIKNLYSYYLKRRKVNNIIFLLFHTLLVRSVVLRN